MISDCPSKSKAYEFKKIVVETKRMELEDVSVLVEEYLEA